MLLFFINIFYLSFGYSQFILAFSVFCVWRGLVSAAKACTSMEQLLQLSMMQSWLLFKEDLYISSCNKKQL
jgi:hypothetical protein